MAVYMLMEKLEDNEEKVVYKFGTDTEHVGIIEFNKHSKSFNICESINDGKISDQAYERWAAEKITKIMFREGGIFPDKTAVEK